MSNSGSNMVVRLVLGCYSQRNFYTLDQCCIDMFAGALKPKQGATQTADVEMYLVNWNDCIQSRLYVVDNPHKSTEIWIFVFRSVPTPLSEETDICPPSTMVRCRPGGSLVLSISRRPLEVEVPALQSILCAVLPKNCDELWGTERSIFCFCPVNLRYRHTILTDCGRDKESRKTREKKRQKDHALRAYCTKRAFPVKHSFQFLGSSITLYFCIFKVFCKQ